MAWVYVLGRVRVMVRALIKCAFAIRAGVTLITKSDQIGDTQYQIGAIL